MPTLTIFTATYNRAHLIGRLYESLLRQKSFDFEWLVIDDGSTDNTQELFRKFLTNGNPFELRYYRQENIGLIKSFNRGVTLANGRYLAKIDSDDYVIDEYSLLVLNWLDDIKGVPDVYGVGGLKTNKDLQPLSGIWPLVDKNQFVDATDIERGLYKLDSDMSEAWNVDVLKQYPFPVWPGEKFAPEQIVFFTIAIKGYKIRWHGVPIQICEYQENGLTLGAFNLQRENPMGYAMMYNQMLDRPDFGIIKKWRSAIQMFAMSIVGGNLSYGFKRNHLAYRISAFLPGLALSIRRKKQFRIK